jgi:N-acetylmuramoyl-L-alanine amidase
MEIFKSNSPNFTKGRGGRKIIAIVDHITAGSFPGCLTWMLSSSSKASAHYLVTRAGNIYQLVQDEDTAWANGEANNPSWYLYDGTNPNRYTLSIEHEGFDGKLTEEQYQATLWLHRYLIGKHGLPVDADHIIGHYRIDSVDRPNCPGPNFPWDRLMADLLGVRIVVGGKMIYGKFIDGTTYAPVRALVDALNRTVEWDGETRTVTVL